jgi:hypothetical protein
MQNKTAPANNAAQPVDFISRWPMRINAAMEFAVPLQPGETKLAAIEIPYMMVIYR